MLLMTKNRFIEMDQQTYKSLIDELTRVYQESGTLGILAITRGDVWHLTLETYHDRYQLELAIRRYRKKGSTVLAVRE